MTREEAIYELQEDKRLYETEVCHAGDGTPDGRLLEALNMAIEALQTEPTKAVSPSLADVYKWERDVALSQLEEYGIGFAEKKRDDLVEVVRCKDCRHQEYCHETVTYTKEHEGFREFWAETIEWCSKGERREG